MQLLRVIFIPAAGPFEPAEVHVGMCGNEVVSQRLVLTCLFSIKKEDPSPRKQRT